MHTSFRSIFAATLLAGSALIATPALADGHEEGESLISLSANVTLASEYRFRGVAQSDGDIAIQGGVDVGLPAGFYVGTWASSIDEDTVGFGHTEVDVYGGWTGDLGGLTVDVGALAYLYPNASDEAGPLEDGSTDFVEFYSNVATGIGPASVELGVAYAPKQDSLNEGDNLYIYSDVGVGVPGTPVSISGHLGYTDGFLTFTDNGKAWDYSVGADLALGSGVSVGVAYIGVEGESEVFTDDAVVVTLGASF